MSRTGLIIVRMRFYSQFCPRELKLEYFSPLTVPPAVVSLEHCTLDGWCSGAARATLPFCRETKPSLTPPVQWGGVPSDRVELVQSGKYKRNMYRGPETSVSPCLVCAQCFGHLDSVGNRTAKLKPGWELAFTSLCTVIFRTKLRKDARRCLWS